MYKYRLLAVLIPTLLLTGFNLNAGFAAQKKRASGRGIVGSIANSILAGAGEEIGRRIVQGIAKRLEVSAKSRTHYSQGHNGIPGVGHWRRFSPTNVSAYEGNTGTKQAAFVLTWDQMSRGVAGYYYTADRPDFHYDLVGENYREGYLVLKEVTRGEVTAIIRLSKSIRKGQVRWSGTMYNTDGRRIPVAIVRVAVQR